MCLLDQQFHLLCYSSFRNLPLYCRLNLLSLHFHTVLDFSICCIWDPGILGNLNILDLPDAFQTYLIYLLVFLLLPFHLPIPNMTIFELVGTPAISMPQVLPNYLLLEVVCNWNYEKKVIYRHYNITFCIHRPVYQFHLPFCLASISLIIFKKKTPYIAWLTLIRNNNAFTAFSTDPLSSTNIFSSIYRPVYIQIVCIQILDAFSLQHYTFWAKKWKLFEKESIPHFQSCILQGATEAEETQPVISELSTPVNKQGDCMLISLGGFCS